MLIKDIDEVKKIAVSARDRAMTHKCNKEEAIKEINDSISRWDKWWKGSIIVILFAVIGAGGFLWRVGNRAADVEHKVGEVQRSVETVTETVGTISVNQKQIQATLKRQGGDRDREGRDQRALIKSAMLEALKEDKKRKK